MLIINNIYIFTTNIFCEKQESPTTFFDILNSKCLHILNNQSNDLIFSKIVSSKVSNYRTNILLFQSNNQQLFKILSKAKDLLVYNVVYQVLFIFIFSSSILKTFFGTFNLSKSFIQKFYRLYVNYGLFISLFSVGSFFKREKNVLNNLIKIVKCYINEKF